MKRLRTFLAMVLVLVAHTAYAADFTQVAGLNGGMVTSIGTTTTGTIIAGTSAAGAFRSTDNGQTWTKITDGISASEILSVGISAGGNILLGTKTNGLFRSDNNGANFAPVGDISTGAITAIRTSANAVYVGTENGIYKSTDNGAAFIQMSGLPSGSAVTAIAVDNSNNVLVGNNAGKLFLSTVATPNGFVEFPFQVTQGENFSVRALAQDAQGNLYASFENNGVYKLTSGGFVWDPISLGSSVVTATSIASTADGRMYITVDGNGIYRSDTNGDNFEQFNLGLTDVNVVSMATATGSQLLVGTKTDGIFRTNAEGTGFTRVGVPALTVTRIATLPGTRVIYAGTASSGI
ncbi:MAG TPA: hypothetical protein VEC36_02160, partial [Patescibacteria group bacterium]|nr:hypothetical protein [Patescibacteria group bacterium]